MKVAGNKVAALPPVGAWKGARAIKAVFFGQILSNVCEDLNWVLPLSLVASTICVEAVSTRIMALISGFYYTISSGDTSGFYSLLISSLTVISVLAVVAAVKQFSIDACALEWREELVLRLHQKYFGRFAAYDLLGAASAPGQPAVDNPDQRIQSDCDKFTLSIAQMSATILPLPGVILYYTWHLWAVFGWIAPVSCYVYFALSSSICSYFASILVPIVYAQDALEGDFRFRHTRYRLNVESISFLHGEAAERNTLNSNFVRLCENMRRLIVHRVPLHFFVTWFSYMGSVVNYGVVGVAILVVLKDKNLSESSAAALLSNGSYACLYLINTFSTLLSMFQEFSQLCGYASRIDELLVFETRRSETPPWLFFNSSNDKSSETPQPNNSKNSFYSKWIAPFEKWTFRWHGSPTTADRYHRLPLHGEEDGVEFTAQTSPKPETLQSLASYPQKWNGDPPASSEDNRTYIVPRVPPLSPCLEDCLLSIKNLSLSRPSDAGKYLVKDLCIDIKRGTKLVVTGASGQGKTSLFRVLAGLLAPSGPSRGSFSNHSRGEKSCRVEYNCGEKDVLFLPQSSYFTEGSINDNIAYPYQHCEEPLYNRSSEGGATVAEVVLGTHGSATVRAGDRGSFGMTLSPGELQRLSIGRALAKKPQLLFMDENTSSVDESTESSLMESVMGCCDTVISIGHRSSLWRFHNMRLHIREDGTYEVLDIRIPSI